jgi:hypothetical protein
VFIFLTLQQAPLRDIHTKKAKGPEWLFILTSWMAALVSAQEKIREPWGGAECRSSTDKTTPPRTALRSFKEIQMNQETQLSLSFFFAVLGLELRAYTLSHSTSPFSVMGFFKIGSCRTIHSPGWL